MWRDESSGTHCGEGEVSYLSHQRPRLPFLLLTSPPTHTDRQIDSHTYIHSEKMFAVCVVQYQMKEKMRQQTVWWWLFVAYLQPSVSLCGLYSSATPNWIMWGQKHPYFTLQLEWSYISSAGNTRLLVMGRINLSSSSLTHRLWNMIAQSIVLYVPKVVTQWHTYPVYIFISYTFLHWSLTFHHHLSLVSRSYWNTDFSWQSFNTFISLI